MKFNNNEKTNIEIPDIQNYGDIRSISIDKVGIKNIKIPINVLKTNNTVLSTIGIWKATVALPSDKKGTHMSRFVSILEKYKYLNINQRIFSDMALEMIKLLEAETGEICVKFDYFLEKEAPLSKTKSTMNYKVKWIATINNNNIKFKSFINIPITSLCPCSKAISKYGAHNQRSKITISVRPHDNSILNIDHIIKLVEKEASCELWSLLKRSDEKYVTERAYNNPKFVEDLVRDIAVQLNSLQNIQCYTIEAENFESIHNHSAYAKIEK
ncbi:GTP cyclohydrolase FolE2 [Candidatus Kinetoplastibacterium sorsogonicusi]|uniref:GTP cyclohydrolase FolE2 n=1 Tax=Candidatus Kinetoplastidibacterium kentomonadis TaxID=1576550 RepID=A0A3Q8EU74_9PROT|nr:GTP cyclohydrolase FolE2 [Candidatus Kinetoplastibacterium sorsogonicusi]AWD32476.1 GTP cyclohydrolase FolE2 [Candidatus Kinetoplastibacterium sorsogonicusi]